MDDFPHVQAYFFTGLPPIGNGNFFSKRKTEAMYRPSLWTFVAIIIPWPFSENPGEKGGAAVADTPTTHGYRAELRCKGTGINNTR
jgi:hypothetical protein